jgi:hypothetical protein
MIRAMRRLATIVLAVALTPAAGAAGNGWTTHRSPAAGISVAAPATWIDVTRLTPQVLKKVSELPSLKGYVDTVQNSKAIKLLLVDVGRATVVDHYATNLNVVQLPTAGDLQFVHDATAAQLKASGVVVGPLRVEYVNLPAGKAVELRYQARFAAGTPTVSLEQFAFVHAGRETVLTYTSLPKRAAQNAAAFLRSARSLRWS